MVLIDDRMAREFYEAGKLRDLSAVRLPQPAPGLEDVLEELGRMEGKRVGLPVIVAPSLITVNEAAFTGAGVAVPPLDWQVEEFEQALRDLKAAGVSFNLSAMSLVDPLVRAYGGQMYDSARQAWAFDTPEAKQGLSALGRLTRDQLVDAEASGKRTIMIGGGPKAPALTMMPAGINVALRGMNVMPLPKGPKGRAVPVGATMGSVLASSANPEAATDFLKAMISDPAMQQAMARAGIRPVSNDSKALAAWQESVGDRMAQVVELSLQGAYVENADTPALVEAMTGLQPFLTGNTSLDQIIPGLISSLN
ncbi:MAG TPA: extracellular solute-binding protein, partial [Symbiobacteriaceae bacterium]|nr:extracellular solute-binding protein [Symbiobacteriaceae bacterium]